MNSEWEYSLHLVKDYLIPPLKEYFAGRGFRWYEDDDFYSQAKESGVGIYLPGWEKKICIEFDKQDYKSGYYGVWDPKHRGNDAQPILGNEKTQAWPSGWEYLGKYNTWNISIAEDIISGKVTEFIIDKFEKLYNIIIENPNRYPMH